MYNIILLLSFAVLSSNIVFSTSTELNDHTIENGVVFCYYGSWSNGRPGAGRFGVNDVPLHLCTHVIYSFIGLTETATLTYPVEEILDDKSNYISDLLSLKADNPNIKIMVAIGGWSEGSENFSAVVNNNTLRADFVSNLFNYIESNGFDGLDLDWEYPGLRGGVESDKEQFVVLVKELKEAFTQKGYLLTAAVGVTEYYIDTSYNVPALSQYLDYINLMTYDYHGSWDNVTGVNSPLYPQLTDTPGLNLDVNSSIHTWLSNGAPPNKLVLGIGAYGRSFTLANPNETSTGAEATGPGVAGIYTAEDGIWSYYEICEDQKNDYANWAINEIDNGSYVYAYKNLFWIGYDNEITVSAKGRYAKSLSLAGIMYWALDLDDFNGLCGEPYPLIRSGITGYNTEVTSPSSSLPQSVSSVTLLIISFHIVRLIN